MRTLIILLLIAAVVFAVYYWLPKKPSFDYPIKTMQTLQQAIMQNNWEKASTCFSDTVLAEHQELSKTKDFYFIEPGTLQGLMGPIPIVGKKATFRIASIDSIAAIVTASYPDFVDKDGRIKSFSLKKNGRGEWKIYRAFHQR